jgi:flagellar basal-body rod protein FlgF
MENALLVGLSRQVALSHELDVVSNNIANINTTGYKADNAAFSEFLTSKASDNDFTGKDKRVSFVQDRNTWIDLSPGAIERTGNPLDVAIDGKGYLTVQTQRGQRYTRNGSLTINSTGQLVTSEGDQVMGAAGPITFPINDQDINISSTGIITARDSTGLDAPRGQLQLAYFDQPQTLQKDGASLFNAPAGANAIPAPPNTRVVQGALEKSNVNAIAAMARMIEITRSYSDISAILQQQSDQRRNALQQLSQPPSSS